MTAQVIALPGGVAPAGVRYAPLLREVAGRAEVHLKDLEVYRGDEPPADYAIELELTAVDALADALGVDRFHLVGYSGGGFISLAYAGTRPRRLLSLAVFEAARVPGSLTPREREFADYLRGRLAGLQGPDYMEAFVREQVKPGAQLSPPPPPDAEMRKRPAGLAAMQRAFDAYTFDRALLKSCRFPVHYAYGDMSHDEQALKAAVVAELLGDIHIERFAGVHHFVPAEAIYSPGYCAHLLDLWATAA